MTTWRGPSGMGFDLVKRMQADLLDHCIRLHADYGDAVKYRLAIFDVFQITAPELVHEVLGPKNRSFVKPARLRQVLGQWNGNGLVLNEGDSWARQRRLVAPSFRAQQVDAYVASFVRNTAAMIEQWEEATTIEVSRALNRLTLRSVTEALFSQEVARHEDRIVEAVSILNEAAMTEMTAPFVLPMWFPSPRKRRLRAAVETLTSVVDELIATRRASGCDGDELLSKMLLAIDVDGDATGMTDRQARDESVNLMLGGNETTATALVWTLYLLARHPEIQDEVAAEVRSKWHTPYASAVNDLELTRFAFSEAMRLYPPAYILSREVAEPVEIGGQRLAPGAQVHILPYITQRDPRWFEDPETFRPRRFEHADRFAPCAYLPFGAGPRACVGKGFALTEGVAVLATILARFRLSVVSDADVELEAQVSLHPKGGLELAIARA